MDNGASLWHEAAAAAQSSIDADLRDDAYEVFVAEASRCRLVDRVGHARLLLRCGATIEGDLVPSGEASVNDHVLLRSGEGELLVPTAVIVAMAGSRPALRSEADREARTLASWLREVWSDDAGVRLLDCTGRWITGRVDLVGADHIELAHDAVLTVVPYSAVEAWQRC